MNGKSNFKFLALAVLALVMVLNSACQPAAAPVAVPIPTDSQPSQGEAPAVDPLDRLVSELGAEGAQVELGEEVQEPFFSAGGRRLVVDGNNVDVFIFPGETERKTASDMIGPTGSDIGTAMVDWVDQPNFWARDELIVLYVGQDAAMINLLSKVLGDPITQHAAAPADQLPTVVAAQQALAQKLGVDEVEITFVSAAQVDWSDSCLGLGGPAESCLAAITPGYLVTFQVGDQTYEVRTNQDGTVVRIPE